MITLIIIFMTVLKINIFQTSNKQNSQPSLNIEIFKKKENKYL